MSQHPNDSHWDQSNPYAPLANERPAGGRADGDYSAHSVSPAPGPQPGQDPLGLPPAYNPSSLATDTGASVGRETDASRGSGWIALSLGAVSIFINSYVLFLVVPLAVIAIVTGIQTLAAAHRLKRRKAAVGTLVALGVAGVVLGVLGLANRIFGFI